MTKVKAKVLNAIVGGATTGQTVEVDSATAAHLESIGYVTIEQTAGQDAKAKAEKRTAENPEKETAKKKKRG